MGTERGVRAGVGPEPEPRASPLSCSDRSSWSAKLASTCTGSSVSSHSRWRVSSSACSSVPLCVNFTAEKQCRTQHAYNTDNTSGISANTILAFFLYLFPFLRFFSPSFFLLRFFLFFFFPFVCFLRFVSTMDQGCGQFLSFNSNSTPIPFDSIPIPFFSNPFFQFQFLFSIPIPFQIVQF